jgi:mRNA-degrading endonuclease RelE of RelBE toxin-antitoxin system
VTLRVELTPAGARQLRRLRDAEALALRGVILALGEEPHPQGSGRLTGTDLWRLRVRIDGVPWRVVYQVREAAGTVVVARVVRRDEATYRQMDSW